MFNSKTLFIIGAGASKEVGLPVGAELKYSIAQAVNIGFEDGYDQTSGDRLIKEALEAHVRKDDGRAGNINPYLHAGWKISSAMPQSISIDNYIDAHNGDADVELVGKLGIARCILSSERSSRIYFNSKNSDKVDFQSIANSWAIIPLTQV